MLNRYDWKNIIKRIIVGVGIAFIIFNVRKCTAFAYSLKGYDWTAYTTDNASGSINDNSSATINFPLQTPIQLNNNYDYISIIFYKYNFEYENDFYIDNPNLYHTSSYSWQCTNGSDYCSNANIIPHYDSIPNDLYGTLTTGSLTLSARAFDSNNRESLCFFDNNISMLLCPTADRTDISKFQISITQKGYNKVNYSLDLFRQKGWYNNESTDIVNGLSGIQTHQQQTNTILTNTDTTSSSNSANTGLNSMNSQLTNQVDSLASVNTYNNIVNNFFTQINNSTCSPISLPMPFVQGKNIVLPCIGTEIQNSAPALWTFWRFMCAGIIGFALWGNFIAFIKGVVDPYNIGANNLPLGGGK